MPETMQCALNECGTFRILVASAVGAVGKLFRQKGWFYKVAGYKASAVDGPCSFTLPPYDHYVVPAPDQPNETAAKLSKVLDGALVLIIDLNDMDGFSAPPIPMQIWISIWKSSGRILWASLENKPLWASSAPFPNNWKRSAQLFRLCGSFCKKRRFHC